MPIVNGILFPDVPPNLEGLERAAASDALAVAAELAAVNTTRAASHAAARAITEAEGRVTEFEQKAREVHQRAGERILGGSDLTTQGGVIAGATAAIEAAKLGVIAAQRAAHLATSDEYTAMAAYSRAQVGVRRKRIDAQFAAVMRLMDELRERDGDCFFTIMSIPANDLDIMLFSAIDYERAAIDQAQRAEKLK